jgi:hypothetical protein
MLDQRHQSRRQPGLDEDSSSSMLAVASGEARSPLILGVWGGGLGA